MSRRTTNRDLAPLPSPEEILEGARYLITSRIESGWPEYRAGLLTANDLAHAARVEGARRLGNGATKGSWSGYMSPAVRISPRLEKMVRDGQLRRGYSSSESDRYRHVYRLPEEGT